MLRSARFDRIVKRNFQVFLSRDTMVAITMVIHLYPFRTEKLSPLVPMVLLNQVGE